MKYLIISTMSSSPWGGSEDVWMEIARDLTLHGINVNVILFRSNLPEKKINELNQLGIAFSSFNDRSYLYRLLKMIIVNFANVEVLNRILYFYWKLKLSKFKFLIINQGGSDCIGNNYALMKAISTLNIRYFIICHSPLQLGSSRSKFTSEFFYRSDAVYALSSKFIADFAFKYNLKLNNVKLFRNPFLIQTSKSFDRSSVDSSLGLNVCFVGRAEYLKGFDSFLRAAASMSAKDVTFHVIGNSKDTCILNGSFRNNSVIYYGELDRSNIPWKRMDVLYLPSLLEALPNVLIEAMLNGVIPIISNAGYISDIVMHTKNGFIVDPLAVESFVLIMDDLILNPEKVRGLKAAAVASARLYINNYSVPDVCRADF